MPILQFAIHQRVLRPINQLHDSNVVMKISCDLIGDGLLGDRHETFLHFLMILIHRVFLVNLDQLSSIVVNLLPEANCGFIRVNFLQVTRQPAEAARHIEAIAPATAGQLVPLTELLLVLCTRARVLLSFSQINAALEQPWTGFPLRLEWGKD